MYIEWHEQSLRNSRDSLRTERRRFDAAKVNLLRREAEVAFYEQQIEAAKARGMAKFDRDKLLITKKDREPRGSK
jgi:hypothetical protein